MSDPAKRAIRTNYFFLAFALGVINPYIAPYFKELPGITNFRLGLLLLVRPVMAIVSQIFWSTIIDHRGHRGRWAMILSIISGLLAPTLLLAKSIWGIAFFFGIWSFFHSPLLILADAMSFDYLGQHRRMQLAFLRIFASMGWITAVMSVGRLYDFWDVRAMFLIFPIGILFSALAASRIPGEGTNSAPNKPWQAVGLLLQNRNIRNFIISVLIFETANQMAYQFLSVYGRELHANNVQLGWIWAVATAAEMVTMLTFQKIAEKAGIKRILAIAMVVTVFRWIPLMFIHIWWQLMLFQTLHAFTLTFGYIGAAMFMDMESPSEIRFTAQAFYGLFVVNTGLILGCFFGGMISEYWGYRALYGVAGVLAGIASLVLTSCVHEPGQAAGPRGKAAH